MKLHLNMNYEKALQQLMTGNTGETLQYIRSLRDHDLIQTESVMEQKLLSFRMALKTNGTLPAVDELSAEQVFSPDLRGEIMAVRGMYYLHTSNYDKAQASFAKASEYHGLYGAIEKSLLAQFNALLSESFNSPADMSARFNELALKAEKANVIRVEALALRQISNIKFDQSLYVEAEVSASRAVELFRQTQVKSDLHLAVVHWADCLVELGKMRQAMDVLAEINAPVDQRVQFPLDYLKGKIHSSRVDLSKYENINTYWLARFRRFGNTAWQTSATAWKFKRKSGLVFNEAGTLKGRVKAASLEGQLLRLLAAGSQNRQVICEVLWPAYAENAVVEDRFFRLVNRLNHKLGSLIVFDGRVYSLAAPLEIN